MKLFLSYLCLIHWILSLSRFFGPNFMFSHLYVPRERFLNNQSHFFSYTGSSIYIGPLVWFSKFLSPFQRNFETNDTSIESTNKELLDSLKKLGVAPSWGWKCSCNWKSITFTKTCLEPSMTQILPVSKLFLFTTIYSFFLRYITLS